MTVLRSVEVAALSLTILLIEKATMNSRHVAQEDSPSSRMLRLAHIIKAAIRCAGLYS